MLFKEVNVKKEILVDFPMKNRKVEVVALVLVTAGNVVIVTEGMSVAFHTKEKLVKVVATERLDRVMVGRMELVTVVMSVDFLMKVKLVKVVEVHKCVANFNVVSAIAETDAVLYTKEVVATLGVLEMVEMVVILTLVGVLKLRLTVVDGKQLGRRVLMWHKNDCG